MREVSRLFFGIVFFNETSRNLSLSIIRKNKLTTQGEKIETAKFRVFVSNISSLPSVKSAIYEIKLFVSRAQDSHFVL